MALLNIFANFRIDSEERFIRMKNSFYSFNNISADRWVINARGPYAKGTMEFLHANLNGRLIAHEKCSGEGWFNDTRQMLPDIDGDYVLFWIEDHASIVETTLLESVIKEMKEKDVDSMWYSWWQYGNLRKRYQGVQLSPGNNIDCFDYTVENNNIVQSNGESFIISAVSIFKSSFFKKLILADDFRGSDKNTPFDFEKPGSAAHWLPFKAALPKQELFACIDNDHSVKGYCLRARGHVFKKY